MEEFTTSLFKENEEKTKNRKVSRERPFYIGLLIFLIGIALYLLESPYAVHFVLGGWLLIYIGRFVNLFGNASSVGHRPLSLKLTKDAVYIGGERLPIERKEDVVIRIVGFKGETIFYNSIMTPKASGNDNIMRIKLGDKISEFKFVLDSERQRFKLEDFCEANGFEYGGRNRSLIEIIQQAIDPKASS